MAAVEPLLDGSARTHTASGSGLRRLTLSDTIALLAFVLLTLLAFIGPLLAKQSPLIPVGSPLSAPGRHWLMGTDEVGRDVFTRVLFGLRSSLLAAAAVIASGVLIGGAIGLAAGALGGWADSVLMRITDIFLALPAPVLAIAVVAALGPSFTHTLLGVAIVWWPFYARIVRGEIKAQTVRPHVDAARLAGVSRSRLWLRHLLPGALPSVLVAASLDVGGLVLTLSGLSFLGLGAPQPAPELGAMSAQGLTYLLSSWWVPLFPAIAIFLLALASNMAGDSLRDVLGDR